MRIKFSFAFKAGTYNNQAALKKWSNQKHGCLLKSLDMSPLTAVKLLGSELPEIIHTLPRVICIIKIP